VKRDNINGVEVFIADGFSSAPHITYRKFGINDGEFPFGCFVTLWWVSCGDEKLDTGQPLFFDAFHDSQHSLEGKKLARINTALLAAKKFLEDRKKVRADGVSS
jgi:hypothetical protein